MQNEDDNDIISSKTGNHYEVNLEELFKIAEIDYTRLYIDCDMGTIGFESKYSLSGEDYLKFAKSDLAEGSDIRARINAVTNAKRAIDCQIDNILYTLHYDLKNGSKTISDYMIDKYCDSESKKALKKTPKLAFISALNLSSLVLISEMRELRNSIEHIYSIPKSREAKKAVEVAELFIGQTNNKSPNFSTLQISDTKIEANKKTGRLTGIWFHLEGWSSEEPTLSYFKWKGNTVDEWRCKLSPDQLQYWLMLRMGLSRESETEFLQTFFDLLRIAKRNIPVDKIKIKKNCFL